MSQERYAYHWLDSKTVLSMTKKFIPQTPHFDSKRVPIRSLVRILNKYTYFIQMEQVYWKGKDNDELVEDYVVSYTVIKRYLWFFYCVVEQTVHSHNFDLQKRFDDNGYKFDGHAIKHEVEYSYQDMENWWSFYCLNVAKKVGFMTDPIVQNETIVSNTHAMLPRPV